MTEAIVSSHPFLPADRQLRVAQPLWGATDILRVAQQQQRDPHFVLESLASNGRAFLECAHDIAQHRLAAGEELPPNLKVVEALQALQARHRQFMAGGKLVGSDITIAMEHQKRDGGVLSITADTRNLATDGVLMRRWTVSAFAQHEDIQQYEETIAVSAGAGFERAELTQERTLQPEDAARLQLLIARLHVLDRTHLTPVAN